MSWEEQEIERLRTAYFTYDNYSDPEYKYRNSINEEISRLEKERKAIRRAERGEALASFLKFLIKIILAAAVLVWLYMMLTGEGGELEEKINAWLDTWRETMNLWKS